ncbi:MAG: 7-carboxy-7-deazaguanine synthase QueE [Akkermansiaceae bacterium]|jgi:7-carboxy-7-deazaguanine synthase|nr:7-carboxy-7-deazaguanine synthase QueE [Akkermansiaceae bacterium]
MKIAEVFHSIQGEGELVGVPSVFVRTSGCNLRCAWCDTPYASWEPEGEEMSVREVAERVVGYRCRHLVLTGGEPMLAPGIRDLARICREAGMHITIETAGTIAPDGICCDLASISPKLGGSTPRPRQFGDAWTRKHERLRLQPGVIARWLADYHCQLKFVVTDPVDLTEIHALLAVLPNTLPPHSVQLMPEGVSPEELAAKRDFVLAACRKFGYRYCHRLHLELFGNTRGT